jgi:hypothetical protein
MNDYQAEQRGALEQIVKNVEVLSLIHGDAIGSYLSFRRQLDEFLECHFARHCTRACFETRTSACCSKDGIITFWADMVINVANSDSQQIDDLFAAIECPMFADKCIYLGKKGCRWQVRPLGCALFLCDRVKDDVLARCLDLHSQWEAYQTMGKEFRWPDRPVLFDQIERVFMAAGCRSPLMYINTSPGLLRIKQQAKLP